jgi:serine/threonine protein kinase
MFLKGPFPARLIKSHLLQTKNHPLQAHFSQVQSSFVFKQETIDPVLGRAVHKEVSLGGKTFKPTLQSKLLKAKSPKDTRAQILLFADLLNKCLVPDPSKRISVKAAMKHEFFGKAAGATATTLAAGTK